MTNGARNVLIYGLGADDEDSRLDADGSGLSIDLYDRADDGLGWRLCGVCNGFGWIK